MPSITDNCRVLDAWHTPDDIIAEPSNALCPIRPTLVTPAEIDRVVLDDCGLALPQIAFFRDLRDRWWRRYELPCPPLVHEEGADRIIRMRGSTATQTRLRINWSFGADNTMAIKSDEEAANNSSAQVIDSHLSLIDHLYGTMTEDPQTVWDRRGGGVAGWPLQRVLDAWRETEMQQGPRPDLVVALADRLERVLPALCQRPRRQLVRHRQMQPVGHVREMDATCMRQLARLPGRSIADKLASNRQVMAVSRIEVTDTLENRVVRKVVDMLISSCRRRLNELPEAGELDASPMLERVNDFMALLLRLREEPALCQAGPLVGVPAPSHALQHDVRYRQVWIAYLQLLGEQSQRDQAVRWRQRLWTESCRMLLLASLQGIQPQATALRGQVLVRREQDNGRFFDDRTPLGRWDLTDADIRSSLLVLDSNDLLRIGATAGISNHLDALAPDLLLVQRDPHQPDRPPKHSIPVWSALLEDGVTEHLETNCRQLDIALAKLQNVLPCTGLLLLPCLESDGAEAVVVNEYRHLKVVRIAMPLQQSEVAFTKILRELLAQS